MTNVIRVDYNALEKIAASFVEQSESIAYLLQCVRGAVTPLEHGGWMGQGAEAFFSEMDSDVLPAVLRLREALRQAGDVSQQICNLMQDADEEASAGFRSGGMNMGGIGGAFSGGVFSTGTGIGNIGGVWGNGGFTPFGGSNSTLEDLINGHGFTPGGIGSFSSGSLGGIFDSLGEAFFGNDSLFNGNTIGIGCFGGNYWGGDLYGYNGGNDGLSIPQDWLSGVKESLNGYTNDNYNDYGIPNDWLDGVLSGGGSDAGGSGSVGGASAGGGAGAGGDMGMASPSAGDASTEATESQPTSGGGSGSAPEQLDIRDPYGRGSFPGDFRGTGGNAAGTEAAVGQSGELRYQTLGNVMGSGGSGGTLPAPITNVSGSSGTLGGVAAANNQSGLGFPFGIAAASPFVALLGKAIKGSMDDD